jgi:hypothetical protein
LAPPPHHYISQTTPQLFLIHYILKNFWPPLLGEEIPFNKGGILIRDPENRAVFKCDFISIKILEIPQKNI